MSANHENNCSLHCDLVWDEKCENRTAYVVRRKCASTRSRSRFERSRFVDTRQIFFVFAKSQEHVRSTNHAPASSMNVICGRVACAPTNSSPRLGSGRSPVSSKRATANLLPKLHSRKNGRGSMFVVRASDGTESSTMDYAGALKFLGLSESASSEDMVRAKNQMIARYENQEDKLQKVSDLLSRVTNNLPKSSDQPRCHTPRTSEAAWVPKVHAASHHVWHVF